MTDDGGQWWFCLTHMRPEQGPGCADRHRMGPYESHDEAAHAMELAKRRNEEWSGDGEDED